MIIIQLRDTILYITLWYTTEHCILGTTATSAPPSKLIMSARQQNVFYAILSSPVSDIYTASAWRDPRLNSYMTSYNLMGVYEDLIYCIWMHISHKPQSSVKLSKVKCNYLKW